MTRSLSLLTEKLINPHNDPRIYWAKEVTFDYSSSHAIRVDYMKFKLSEFSDTEIAEEFNRRLDSPFHKIKLKGQAYIGK